MFNSRGEREAALSAAGGDMLRAFETLLARLAEGPAAGGAGAAFSADAEQGEETALERETRVVAPLAALLQVRLLPVLLLLGLTPIDKLPPTFSPMDTLKV